MGCHHALQGEKKAGEGEEDGESAYEARVSVREHVFGEDAAIEQPLVHRVLRPDEKRKR